MPYRRSRSRSRSRNVRRRLFSRSRSVRRRFSRAPRGTRRALRTSSRVTNYKRTFTLYSLSTSTPAIGATWYAQWGISTPVLGRGLRILPGTWGGAYMYFRLSDMPSYTDYTAMFQQYRINGVKIAFRAERFGHVAVVGEVGSATNSLYEAAPMPEFYTVPDLDGDDTTLSSTFGNTLDIMQQMPGFRRAEKGWRGHTRTIKPKVRQAIYGTPTTWGYAAKRAPWINTSDPNVAHNGLLVATNVLNANSKFEYLIQVEVTYSVSFRGFK